MQPIPPPPPPKRRWWLVVLVTSAFWLLTWIVFASMVFPGSSVVQAFPQPDSIVYEQNSHFGVYLKHDDAWLFAHGDEAWIGRDAFYGVVVPLATTSNDQGAIHVTWTPDGVTIFDAYGITHFVPTKQFIGGR